MPSFRYYLLDRENQVTRSATGSCDERDVRTLASQLLKSQNRDVRAIEVWDGDHQLARIDRD